ncbi:hypothetical protein DFQ30_010739, partial [Apophysomyces sp. BC1015]
QTISPSRDKIIDESEQPQQQQQQQQRQETAVVDVPGICHTESVVRNTDPNHNYVHLRFWQHFGADTAAAYRSQWQEFMQQQKNPPKRRLSKGRGIVLVAGNRDTFARALTTIKVLRNYQCTLPIEVWHLPDEQPSATLKDQLTRLDAVPRNLATGSVRPVQQRRHNADKQFQIKAAAILNAGFNHIIYLDSDNIPTRDPSFLFDTSEYMSTGAIFWPDFWKTHGENKIFDVLGIQCQDEWEQESGQMVIDKYRSWGPLQLAWYMQAHYEVYFQFLNGDKDTFKYAWKALGQAYHMVPTFLGMAGTMRERFCGHTMVQYFDDEPLFIHANLMKITDRINFIENGNQERPWKLLKRYSVNHDTTWLLPEFHVSGGQACMDIRSDNGEPEAVTESFDDVIPGFQKMYFDLGGVGGETR